VTGRSEWGVLLFNQQIAAIEKLGEEALKPIQDLYSTIPSAQRSPGRQKLISFI